MRSATKRDCSFSSRALDEHGRLARVVHAREEVFAVALLGLGDDRVRHVEDGLRAAEVLLQLDDLRGGKEFGELKHVPVARPAERVDRLALVADDRDVVVRRRQQAHDARLKRLVS
jgi:hypothetical protein